jgi:tripartite-type tricarboxylate transporter receptor subunit TctC
MRRSAVVYALGLAIAGPCGTALAQSGADVRTYPTKPVRMIVVFPPGSGTDIAARLIGQELSEKFGRQFVVDNRPGAGGMMGTEAAVNSNPDGYTLLVVSSSHTISPSVYAKLPYDPVKDLAPISMIGSTPYLFVAHPSVKVKSVRELIELAKAKPGQLNYAAGGVGVGSHLAGELFKSMAQVKIEMVAYKGAPQATTDVVAGQVQLAFSTFPTGLPLVKSGKLVGLGVTGPKRLAIVPDIPAVAETLPGFDVETWFGMLAPARTPVAIVTKIHQAVAESLKKDAIRDRLSGQGYQTVGNTPQQFGQQIAAETEKWRRVVKTAGIKPIGGSQ